MEEEVVSRIEAILKDAGYTGFETRRATGTITVTGRKGEAQFVVHFTENSAAPGGGRTNTARLDPSVMHVRAGLPGLSPEAISAVLAARRAPTVIGVTSTMTGGSA
jgi:predicted transcriptional regulator